MKRKEKPSAVAAAVQSKPAAMLVSNSPTGEHLGVIEPLDNGSWIAKRYGPGYPNDSAIFPDADQAEAYLRNCIDGQRGRQLVQRLKDTTATAGTVTQASRRLDVPLPDVKAVRERIGLSQSEFARLMHVSIKTLQNWEQHRRQPTGPAAALLRIVLTAPEVALTTLHA